MLTAFCLPVMGDDDCDQNAIADCDFEGTAALKLKRLFDIDMGEWSGHSLLEGVTQPAQDGRRFCIIAYNELTPRVIHDYSVTASAESIGGRPSAVDGEFVLRQGDNILPVSLRLKGMGPAVSIIDYELTPGIALSVQGHNTYTSCINYEYVIQVQVSRDDVLNYGASGSYRGKFSIGAFTFIDGKLLRVQENFTVSMTVTPAFQVNKLDDVTLNENQTTPDGRVYQDMHFCVFAMGERNYRLSLSSQLRPAEPFTLDNGVGRAFPYRARVRLDNGNWDDFIAPGSTADGTLKGHNTLNCAGGENSTIRIDFAGADTPTQAGFYRDIMEIVVGPE